MKNLFSLNKLIVITLILIIVTVLIALQYSSSYLLTPSSILIRILPVILLILFIEYIVITKGRKKSTNYIPLKNMPPKFEDMYNSLCPSAICELENFKKNIKFYSFFPKITFILFILSYLAMESDYLILSPITHSLIIIGGTICFPLTLF